MTTSSPGNDGNVKDQLTKKTKKSVRSGPVDGELARKVEKFLEQLMPGKLNDSEKQSVQKWLYSQLETERNGWNKLLKSANKEVERERLYSIQTLEDLKHLEIEYTDKLVELDLDPNNGLYQPTESDESALVVRVKSYCDAMFGEIVKLRQDRSESLVMLTKDDTLSVKSNVTPLSMLIKRLQMNHKDQNRAMDQNLEAEKRKYELKIEALHAYIVEMEEKILEQEESQVNTEVDPQVDSSTNAHGQWAKTDPLDLKGSHPTMHFKEYSLKNLKVEKLERIEAGEPKSSLASSNRQHLEIKDQSSSNISHLSSATSSSLNNIGQISTSKNKTTNAVKSPVTITPGSYRRSNSATNYSDSSSEKSGEENNARVPVSIVTGHFYAQKPTSLTLPKPNGIHKAASESSLVKQYNQKRNETDINMIQSIISEESQAGSATPYREKTHIGASQESALFKHYKGSLPASSAQSFLGSNRKCLRCHKLYSFRENQKKSCRYHPKAKMKLEKYDGKGRLSGVTYIWECCMQKPEMLGCRFGEHV